LKVITPPLEAVEILQSLPQVSQVCPIATNTFDLECTMGIDCRPTVAQFVVEKGWGLLELHAVSLSLEDVFLELTADQKVKL
jgi:hypothetical protein